MWTMAFTRVRCAVRLGLVGGGVLAMLVLLAGRAQGQPPAWLDDAAGRQWADSVLETLSLHERVAQAFMVTAYSKGEASGEERVLELVKEQGVGGVIFFQGTAKRQCELTNRYQQAARVPLLIGIDGEWGLGMRLSDAVSYPRAMALAATGMPLLAYRMGASIAQQMQSLGVHINFAPVVDVNSNPENPVIGVRAFSDDPEQVREYGMAYMLGMQQNGVLACAKHFPGHGNTQADSHHALPFVTESLDELENRELAPFRALVKGGVSMVMTGHLDVPALGTEAGQPTSLSKEVVTELLRKKMDFRGLTCSDALNMRGGQGDRKPEEVALQAYMAGNDILLCPEAVEKGIRLIVRAVKVGTISQEEVDSRCRRILQAKYWAVGRKARRVDEQLVAREVSSREDAALREEIAKASLTLLRDNSIPIQNLEVQRIGYVSFLGKRKDYFAPMMRRYTDVNVISETSKTPETARVRARNAVGSNTLMVIAVRAMGLSPSGHFGFTAAQEAFVQECATMRPTIVVLFGTPYALQYLGPTTALDGLLVAYGDDRYAQEAAAQALFGGTSIQGRLPVAVPPEFKSGDGKEQGRATRLGYSSPEFIGADTSWIAVADSLARMAIDSGACPGMQVLAAKGGRVFYRKFFGRYTYLTTSPEVTDTAIYDLASVTKVVATTPLVMRLIEKKKPC